MSVNNESNSVQIAEMKPTTSIMTRDGEEIDAKDIILTDLIKEIIRSQLP